MYDAMHSAALYKCAAPAVPVTDTVKETDHDTVVRTLNRSALAAIQTPQAFVKNARGVSGCGSDRVTMFTG